MITLQPMNICAGRRRPAVAPGARRSSLHPHRPVRGRHGLDPVLPRPARPHLRHAPRLDRAGLRRPPAERRVPRPLPHVLHRRSGRAAAARRDRPRQHRLGVRLPAQRLIMARSARGTRQGCAAVRRARAPTSTGSPTATRRGGTRTIPSRTSRRSRRRSARCGRGLEATTSASGPSTTAASNARTKASRSARWRRRQPRDAAPRHAATKVRSTMSCSSVSGSRSRGRGSSDTTAGSSAWYAEMRPLKRRASTSGSPLRKAPVR